MEKNQNSSEVKIFLAVSQTEILCLPLLVALPEQSYFMSLKTATVRPCSLPKTQYLQSTKCVSIASTWFLTSHHVIFV